MWNAAIDSRDLKMLTPDFKEKVEALLAACRTRGIEMKPFFTVRGPQIQARLWSQSRPWQQVATQAAKLRAAGAPWLASLLRTTYVIGSNVTNALPGESWHQWGEAIDCYVVGKRNEAIWSTADPGYEIYAEEAVKLGLDAGAHWKSFKDTVHVQLRKEASPTAAGLSWIQIEAKMLERFDAQSSK